MTNKKMLDTIKTQAREIKALRREIARLRKRYSVELKINKGW